MGIYNYAELRGLMRARDKTQEEVAKAVSIAPSTFSQKLNGRGLFKQNEIEAITAFLGIHPCDVGKYFFTH